MNKFIIMAMLVIVPVAALAKLGETEAQIAKRYGLAGYSSTNEYTGTVSRHYTFGKFSIEVTFIGGVDEGERLMTEEKLDDVQSVALFETISGNNNWQASGGSPYYPEWASGDCKARVNHGNSYTRLEVTSKAFWDDVGRRGDLEDAAKKQSIKKEFESGYPTPSKPPRNRDARNFVILIIGSFAVWFVVAIVKSRKRDVRPGKTILLTPDGK